jgi:cell division protein ZapD
LRLEYLFEALSQRIEGLSEWDSRAALVCLIDITDLLGRNDIKSDLIKELERLIGIFSRSKTTPNFSAATQQNTIQRMEDLVTALREPAYLPCKALRQDELVSTIRQRLAIAGGACNFDVPAFHYWLNQADQDRMRQLHRWAQDLLPMEEGITLALQTIREGVDPMSCVAPGGLYQQTLEPGLSVQLLRIILPADSRVFPEISAGKHRFTLRFLEQPETTSRATQTSADIAFQLQCCAL